MGMIEVLGGLKMETTVGSLMGMGRHEFHTLLMSADGKYII